MSKELKINPENELAKKVKEKLTIHSNFPTMTIYLLIINIIVFIFTFPEISLINSIKFGISNFNLGFASALTSIFFHINSIHFLINILKLGLFGPILEKYIGSTKFLLIYLVSGLLGNLIEALISNNSIVIGASGALFGILGALMMREPLLKVRLFGVVQIPIIFLLGLFFSFSLIQNVFVTNYYIVGDLSHIIGIFVGIFFIGIFNKEKISVFYNWLFIAAGFWLISFIINLLLEYGLLIDLSLFLVYIFILIFSILIIIYSYAHLKTLEEFSK